MCFCYILFILNILDKFCNCQVEKKEIVRNVLLVNEECKPRRQLIQVDVPSMAHFTPMIVSAFRCGGVADEINPLLKTCVKNSSEILRFPVINTYNPNNVIYKEIENHISCRGQCIHNRSVCKGASSWDEKNCKCLCLIYQECPKHFIWDPIMCKCVCDRACPRRKELDPEECTCNCKSKFYRRCQKRGLTLDHGDCYCVRMPLTLGVCSPCECKK